MLILFLAVLPFQVPGYVLRVKSKDQIDQLSMEKLIYKTFTKILIPFDNSCRMNLVNNK